MTIGDVIGGIHNSVIAGRDVIIHAITGSTAEQRALRNRRAMLELVRNFWVKGVLEQSLHGAAMIELGMEERADAVEHPWDTVLQMPDQPERPLPRGTKLVDIFDEMNRALLILGEPGSGKTTMLLELARDTIARAEGDPTQPIPVVFNLSSWAEKRQSIAEWLVEELNTKYNIPRTIARPWVENDDLLLLLDGLDEVKREHRNACVEAINAFRREHGLMPLLVCSRVADYEALTARLKLQGAVLLQPLRPEQIDRYLAGAGTELLAVRRTLQHDPTFQELAQSPLMLSVMTLAYRGISVEDLGSLDLIEARRRHVFDAYVQRMFERRGVDQPYSPEQTIRWLTWLAQKMTRHAQTVFLIERMQPGWLQARAPRWLPVVAVNLTGVLGGVLSGVLIGRLTGVMIGVPVGALSGVLVRALANWISKLKPKGSIEPTEVVKLSWEARRLLFFWLFIVLVTGLLGVLSGGLIGGLFCVLIFGVLIGLFIALPYVLAGMRRVAEVEIGTVPNQGIRQSAQNAATMGLIFGLIVGLICWPVCVLGGALIFQLINVELIGDVLIGGALIGGLISAVGFGLHFGGVAVIKHFILRLILYRSGHIPWNYARFLDYAAERIFLRKVGSGYVFIHRLLMDYLLTPDEAAMGYCNRGIVCYNSGDFEQAILDFTRSIELDSDNAEAYHGRGIAYQVSGDLEQAIADCTRAAELDPDNAEYWDSLCLFGISSGRVSDVIYACERAVELDPGDGQFRDSRGVARALTGDYDGAIEDFRFFVEWSEENDLYEWYAARRNAWIAELEAGQNLFDEAALEQLLNETLDDLLDYFAAQDQDQEAPLPLSQ